jgi:hypothetical protein
LSEFLLEQFGSEQNIPQWVKNALDYAGYKLELPNTAST